MNKEEKRAEIYTTIQRLKEGGMATDSIDMSQQEYEKLINQYSTGFHSEQKYIPFTQKDAEKLARDNEMLIGAGGVRTEGFEKAVVFLMTLMERIFQVTQKNKSFRMELFYNAETLKTNYCFFVPTDKSVSDGIRPGFSENQD